MQDLTQKHCQVITAGTPPLSKQAAGEMLGTVREWILSEDGKQINRQYRFKNYYETMAFINALAWIAHQEDHHPDLEVSYNRCMVRFSTHSIGGLSENDFICAKSFSRCRSPS